MKLSRRQQIALKLLDASWTAIDWTAISATLKLLGEKSANGNVTCSSLINKGLVRRVEMHFGSFCITSKGREVAKTIKVTVQIEQVKT